MRSWQDLVGPGGTAPIEVCSFRDSRQHINSFLRATKPSARGEGRNVDMQFPVNTTSGAELGELPGTTARVCDGD